MANKHILFIQTAFLGDLLLSTALLKNLKRLYPQAQLHLLCRQGLGGIFKELDLVHHSYEIKKGNSQSYKEASDKLQAYEFEIIFSAHESLRTAFLVKSLRAKNKVCFKNAWNFLFYNQRVKKNKQWPESLRVLQLLTALHPELYSELAVHEKTNFSKKQNNGILISPPERASIRCTAELEIKRDLSLMSPEKRDWFDLRDFYVLFPGSVWETKKWPENKWIDLARELSRTKTVVLCGGKDEFAICENIRKALQNTAYPVLNNAGTLSLNEVMQFLINARAVISNDSAGSHMAALADRPTLVVYGPTIPEFGYRPWSTLSTFVQIEDLSCRPCGPHGHRRCPLETHECMKSLSAQQVVKALTLLETLSH